MLIAGNNNGTGNVDVVVDVVVVGNSDGNGNVDMVVVGPDNMLGSPRCSSLESTPARCTSAGA